MQYHKSEFANLHMSVSVHTESQQEHTVGEVNISSHLHIKQKILFISMFVKYILLSEI